MYYKNTLLLLYKQNNTFYFKYILENLKEVQENGFMLLIPFPQINAIYYSPLLFASFATDNYEFVK